MEKISKTIKRMNLFQKIQVLSAVIPSYSCLFVIIATYIVCWKNKLPFLAYGIYYLFIYLFCFTLVSIELCQCTAS